jgi:hypothetical protein
VDEHQGPTDDGPKPLITHPSSLIPVLCPLTAHQQTVSGSLSLPSPGVFSPFPHGTLRYRSLWLFSLGAWSPLLPTRFLVSGGTHDPAPRCSAFAYRALTVSGGPSQGPSTTGTLAHSAESRSPLLAGRSTPPLHRPTGHLAERVWAPPVSLATTPGISRDFCAGGTEMFPFPPAPASRLTRSPVPGFPIRTSAALRVVGPSPRLLAAIPRPSSAPQRQGIHRPPSSAFTPARPRSCDLSYAASLCSLGNVPTRHCSLNAEC